MIIDYGQAFNWSEIDQAPQSPGVYAWYSQLVIVKADIDAAISSIEMAKAVSVQRAKAAVTAALDQFVFNPYRESPYLVQLRGALKPRFGGEVAHEPNKSDSLVDRLVADPQRFTKIGEILGSAAPGFTAPLYIGMAFNLRARLRQHKRKITELRDLTWHMQGSEESSEAGFANQVVARGFDPTNLFVLVKEVSVDSGEHNDIENILNRINYPIFGRN